MTNDEKTLFQKILDGDLPASFLARGKSVFAILDINPVNPGHALVITNEPYRDLSDVPSEVITECMDLAKSIAEKQKSELGATGVNVIHNMGADAGQIIFHTHIPVSYTHLTLPTNREV